MKILLRSFAFMLFIMISILFGQEYYPDTNYNPDSLETVTVSGRVLIDSALSVHPVYFMDINNDNKPYYMLNFGPYWYEPDSSTAVRPKDGDPVTIYGGTFSNPMVNYDMLIVYEINGEFWREPFDPVWNNLDGFMNMAGRHDGECDSFGFGWNHDSLNTITTSGILFVDSTFIYSHYYIDMNNDGIPDYMLNFGPPWYEPGSGTARPGNGEKINITGGEIDIPNFNMIVVYTINGMTWRDSSDFGFNFGGGWMNNSLTQTQHFYSPFDTSDWMEVHPGWQMGGGGMHGGMMMPDSIFTQIFELFPGNLPDIDNQNAFAGYQFDMLYPDGHQGMGPMGNCGGMMQFNNNINFQLHYNDIQLQGYNIDENTIKVKYYDNTSSSWIDMPGIKLNTSSNTIIFSNNYVSNLVILTGEKTSTGILNNQNKVKDFQLFQNYPNPFNPTTNIKFALKENSHITLSIYNIIGQKVVELVNSDFSSGIHNVMFNAAGLSSGIYFYELKAGTYSAVMKMELLK